MLLVWFIIVLALSLVLIYYGYSFSQPPLAISGATLLFLLGSVVMFSSILVGSGYTGTILTPCDDDCTLIRDGVSVSLITTNVSLTYSPILEEEVVGIGINHLLGLFMALIGVFCFIDVLLNLRGLK